jgi:hypothetical protein
VKPELTFAVVDPDGQVRSSIWKLKATKSGIYLGTETMAIFKVSIHTERKGQRLTLYAVDSGYECTQGLPPDWPHATRTMHKKHRDAPPQGLAARPMVAITWPTQHLSPAHPPKMTIDVGIEAAPAGQYVELCISCSRQAVPEASLPAGVEGIGEIATPDGDFAQMFIYYKLWPSDFFAREFEGKSASWIDFPTNKPLPSTTNRGVLTRGFDDNDCLRLIDADLSVINLMPRVEPSRL